MKSILIILLTVLGMSTSFSAENDPEKSETFKKSQLTKDASETTADKRRLLLTAGEEKVVDVEFDARADGIAIGNVKVIATTLVKIGERKQIVFKPLSAGNSTVTVRDQAGNIRVIFDVKVTGSNLLKMAGELRDLLKEIEGITIRIVGNKIVIEGDLIVPDDYAKLADVINSPGSEYDGLVMNLTQFSPLALRVISKKIKEDINTFAPNVGTRVVNSQVWLEGTVDSPAQADRAVKVATLYLPEIQPQSRALLDAKGTKQQPPRGVIQNFIVVNPPPPKKMDKLVRVTVHFVELSKDYAKNFGFKWQPGFTTDDPQVRIGPGSDGTTGASGTSFSATIANLFPKLQSAQSAGFARILRTGTVIVRSGLPAQMRDQTEIPFTIQAANGQQTAPPPVKVGLSLGVTPQILGQSEDMELNVDLEQSSLTGKTVSDAPIVSVHSVKTKLYVKSSESAALAGVESSDLTTSFNKDDPNPGSFQGRTSPLFTFLRSKSYNKKKSQYVIFITPQIIENASQGTEDLKKNFRVKVR